ncbi:hypothetical protein DMUE_6402, partial [Dictyocoela muelleri]
DDFINIFYEEYYKKEKVLLCVRCLGKVKIVSNMNNKIRCVKAGCRKMVTFIPKPPFFKSHLSLDEILKVIFHLINGEKVKTIVSSLGFDKKTIRRILISIGKIIETYNEHYKIGGEGVIVEVDESKFGRRKYNRGHRVEGTWIVGGVERSSLRRFFLEKVVTRDAITLQGIIQRRVNHHSVIF